MSEQINILSLDKDNNIHGSINPIEERIVFETILKFCDFNSCLRFRKISKKTKLLYDTTTSRTSVFNFFYN